MNYVPPFQITTPLWHYSIVCCFSIYHVGGICLPDQLFYSERFVDWGNLEIAYFNWHALGCHQDFKALGIGRVLTSYTCMKLFWNSLVSYLKIAAGHAHTDCNSLRALVAALNETLMSNDNCKSALPLTTRTKRAALLQRCRMASRSAAE